MQPFATITVEMLDILSPAEVVAWGRLRIEYGNIQIGIGSFDASYTKLAELWHCTERQAKRLVKGLCDAGYLELLERGSATGRKANTYRWIDGRRPPEGVSGMSPQGVTQMSLHNRESSTEDTTKRESSRGVKNVTPTSPRGNLPASRNLPAGEDLNDDASLRSSSMTPPKREQCRREAPELRATKTLSNCPHLHPDNPKLVCTSCAKLPEYAQQAKAAPASIAAYAAAYERECGRG